MTLYDLTISLDRLTRFKYTERKYLRVFSCIISKYLTEPKLNKNDIEKISPKIMRQIVEIIWNSSIEKYGIQTNNDFSLNGLIIKEEKNAFNISDEINELLNAKINYKGTLEVIRKISTLPLNLKRLMLLENNCENSIECREKLSLKFPVEKVILCEGITEEILLPKFAEAYDYNFNKYGVHLISAGGKNQVAKLYCELKDELKLPIFILLDADAQRTASIIENILREKDTIHLIKHGEFEDIFSLTLIKRTINNKFKNILQASVSEFKKDMPMTKVLCEYFRENQLGDFQKSDFAKEVYANVNSANDLTDEIKEIIDKIKNI